MAKTFSVSRAKTAWGLLQDVKRTILAEPKRADMRVYMAPRGPEDGGPPCGTVGCFAGWVLMLSGAAHHSSVMTVFDVLGPDLNYRLGVDVADSTKDHVFNTGGGDACERTVPGTKAHARAVVNRINGFMRRNAAALKSRKLARQTIPAHHDECFSGRTEVFRG